MPWCNSCSPIIPCKPWPTSGALKRHTSNIFLGKTLSDGNEMRWDEMKREHSWTRSDQVSQMVNNTAPGILSGDLLMGSRCAMMMFLLLFFPCFLVFRFQEGHHRSWRFPMTHSTFECHEYLQLGIWVWILFFELRVFNFFRFLSEPEHCPTGRQRYVQFTISSSRFFPCLSVCFFFF